jgi:hypothetical protein
MLENPLDFWESVTLSEIIAWGFVFAGFFLLFTNLLEYADVTVRRRRLRKLTSRNHSEGLLRAFARVALRA